MATPQNGLMSSHANYLGGTTIVSTYCPYWVDMCLDNYIRARFIENLPQVAVCLLFT